MALKPGQKNALDKLAQREASGNIQQSGMDRLASLREQQGGGKGKNPNKPVKTPLQKMKPKKPKTWIQGQRFENREAAEDTFQYQNPSQQINPYGSQEVTRDENGNVVVNQSFAPGQQQIFDSQQQMMANLYGQGAQGTGVFGGLNNPGGERQRIEQGLYENYTRGFDQEKAQALEGLEQSLAERGIMPGSGENYTRSMQDFNDQWNNRYDSARTQAVSQGGEEWARSSLLPLQQAQGLFALGGPNMGQFAGYQGVNVNPTDVTGTMLGNKQAKLNKEAQDAQIQLGYAGLANAKAIAGMQQHAGGGGVSGPPPPPYTPG